MGRTRIYGLDPDQVGRLLSLGTDGAGGEPGSGPEPTAAGRADFERPGAWIGRYKLLRVLGEGGMGIVYLAEQEGAIKRQVALKVVKPGMDSKRVIARFEAERQALALLDHPNIAHVHDAGTTDSGRPYFVMEYVEGPPITDYCDRHKLGIDERLRLFQQVCLAIHHAHQKGIIHRDIKPSNILVYAEPERAIPKIIDFGVAKAISQPLTERTSLTEDSHLLGTPEYMSPEQADLANEDIDTRSDIYSLGVLLYELLAGILPYDSETFRQGGVEHIRRVIRETDPRTPSTRLTRLGEEARKLAESRRTEVVALAKRLHRELEWIPLKAMRKARSERYRSASELSDDIENYVTGRPLIAGPLGTWYRLSKSMQRHRALVAATTAILVVLIAGIITSTVFAVRAERALSHAQAVSDFLLRDVLDAGRDGRLLERDFEDMLENATKGLEGKFKDQPLVEAEIRYTLGQKYLEAFKPEGAKLHLERAYQIRLQQFGPEDQRGLHIAMMLGWAHSHLGHYDDAIRMWTDQIDTLRRAYGDAHWRIMLLMTSIGEAYGSLGNYEEAEACFDEALKRWGQLRNPSAFTGRLAAIQKGRGGNYLAQGRYAEAEHALCQALELKLPSGVNTLSCMRALSAVYREQGQYEKAQQLCETALDTMRGEIGDDHYEMLNAKCELGRILMARGLLPEAEKLISEALRNKRLKRSVVHENAFSFINALAVVRTKQGEYADANDLFAEALEGRKHTLGESHPQTLETLNDLGVLRREQGHHEEAQSLLRQALEGRQRKLGPDHPACFESMHEIAILHVRQARYEDAESLLLEAFHGRQTKLDPEHPHTLDSLKQLVTLYELWPKPGEAAKWRAKRPHN